MSDESVTSSSVSSPIAADVINSAAYQRMKISVGADGVAGDATPSNPLPVAPIVGTSAVSAANPLPMYSGGATSTTITAAAQACTLSLNGGASVGFSVASGLNAILTPEYTIDGTNWLAGAIQTNATSVSSATLTLTASAVQGVVQAPPGAIQVRLRCSTFTSGSAAVALAASGLGAVRITDATGAVSATVKTSAALLTDPALVVAISPSSASALSQSLAMSSTANSVAVVTTGMASVGGQVTGTWTGTLIIEGTVDGTNWFSTFAYAPTTGVSIGTTTTSFAGYNIPCAGYNQIRVRCSVVGTGTAVVNLQTAWDSYLSGSLPTGSNVIGAITQSGNWTMMPGNTANTTPWLFKISDGTNAAAIQASGVTPLSTDPALTVSLSPNSSGAVGVTASGTLSSTASTVTVNVSGGDACGFFVGTGLVATIAFTYSIDGTNFTSTYATVGTTGSYASSTAITTSTFGRIIVPAGATQIKVTVPSFTSGSATLTLVTNAAGSTFKIVGAEENIAVAVKGASTAATTSDGALTTTLSPNSVAQKIGDGTSTAVWTLSGVAPVSTAPALVVALSPNSPTCGTNTSGTLAALNAVVACSLNGMPGAGWSIPATSTLIGAVKGQYSFDGSNWFDADVTTTSVASGTAYYGYIEVQPGAIQVRLIASTYSSGTTTAYVNASPILGPKVNPGKQIWKSFALTTSTTGTLLWTPNSGNRIVITHYDLSSSATTQGKVILFLNSSASYTEGTTQPVGKYTFTPTANSTPGALVSLSTPIIGTKSHNLYVSTSANITIDGVIYGYEVVG